MNTEPLMQWEMYGPSTALQFLALRVDDGYSLTVTRDHSLVMSAFAETGESLLRKSAGLRDHLRELGYAAKPLPSRAVQLPGGLCWGPSSALASSMLLPLGLP